MFLGCSTPWCTEMLQLPAGAVSAAHPLQRTPVRKISPASELTHDSATLCMMQCVAHPTYPFRTASFIIPCVTLSVLLACLLGCSAAGVIAPLPDVIPSDLYSFELTSDWEQAAYQQLLAAPTSTPPDSPPPLRNQRNRTTSRHAAFLPMIETIPNP